MTDVVNFSTGTETHDATEVPTDWLNYERKSTIIAEKFIAFKTPLDGRFTALIRPADRWSCAMLIKYIQNDKKNLGLVIDLTNPNRYYLSNPEFIDKKIRYEKIPCREDDTIPNDEQVNRFIQICSDFIQKNPTDIIGVHCTYGVNQTGFLICAYLCQKLHYNVVSAIELFAKARTPGIQNQNYLNKLIEKFTINNTLPRQIERESKPRFAVQHKDVIPIVDPSIRNRIRLKCQTMCEWNRECFPGTKPTTIHERNYETILNAPYKVTWKADGTRYMMLIENQDQIYMIDRNNNVFKIHNLRFPNPNDFSKHLTDTLIDGEFVIDHHNEGRIYRYLVFDIIRYENENIGQKTLNERLDKIRNDVVDVRNNAIMNGLIDKRLEPFSIRVKMFYGLSKASELLAPSFRLPGSHEIDGLILQLNAQPYQFGRSSNVLKWNINNTIDFRLKIENHQARLYLNNMSQPYAFLTYSPTLDQYNDQIIECSYQNNQWIFYRHRPDRNYPNTQTTAAGIMEAVKDPISENVLYSLINQAVAFDAYLKQSI